MRLVSVLFFLASIYYLYFFVALGQTNSFFGFANLFLAGILIWAMTQDLTEDKLWFKIKGWGYGWAPATWQGWTVTILITIMIVFAGMILSPAQHSVSDFLINFIPFLGLAIAVLVAICLKTGEKPKWNWGRSDKDL